MSKPLDEIQASPARVLPRRDSGKRFMGYDEPTSKRQASVYGPTATKRQNPWIRRSLLAIIAIGVGGYFASDPQRLQSVVQSVTGGAAPQAGRAGRGVGAAPPVRVATAQVQDVAVTVRTIGTVLANSVVTVKSQVDGPLLSAGFKEGQMVKKGDLLFQIDPAPFQAALRQAQAQVDHDKAQLASAQADADRAVMLSQRGIVSDQQRDQLVASAKALVATVAADAAAVERSQLNLDYTVIRSPVNGKTGPLLVYPGNQVHASDASGLITINEIQPVKISFNLPQGDLPQLQDRMSEGKLIAGVTTRNDISSGSAVNVSAGELPMKVDFVGNVVDDKTGTIELRATFDNPDLRLVPGELVDVSVRLATLSQAVTVPREGVNIGQNGNYVFVVDAASTAQMRPVTVLYQDQMIAALGVGVKPGDRVVTDGQLRLTPGIKVLVTQPEGQPQANQNGSVGASLNEASSDSPAEAVKVANPVASGGRGG
jgi:multidrug efflux system membrane fusion protein